MSRQRTLVSQTLRIARTFTRSYTRTYQGAFFTMPPNAKRAPPQQASLKAMWAKGKKTDAAKAAAPTEEPKHVPEELSMDVDVTPQVPDPAFKTASPPPKRKAEGSPTNNGVRSKVATKKRRVIESDEEDDTPAAATSSPAAAKSSSPAKSSPVPVAKRVKKLVPPPQEEEDSEREQADAEVRPAEDEEGEDEVEANSDAEDAEVSQVALKNAEWAVSKIEVVDVHKWKSGQDVPYAALAHTFSLIEATTKRLEKSALLTAFLLLVIQRSAPEDRETLLKSVYLCINRLCPDYEGKELGIGESLLIKAIANATGRTADAIKTDMKKEGDLGIVAVNSKKNQKALKGFLKEKSLTVKSVFASLQEIANTTGNSSQAHKIGIISKMLGMCKDHEAKYIIRSLEGKLRIGNAERSVLISLSHAVVLAEKEKAQKKWSKEKLAARLEQSSNVVKQVYSELPNYNQVIPALLEVGVDGLAERCKLTPGVPLKPMLAKPTKAIGEVLNRFEAKRFTCEYKYDGERAQVHRLDNGSMFVYSRNSEDMSKKYPELVDHFPKCFTEKTTSFVLDAEAVAVDRTTSKLLPFQELSKRKRKDVKIEDIQVRVCLFAFDLLFLNGEPLLHKTLEERRELLREHFTAVPGEFDFAKSSDGETTEEIQLFLEESIKDGCEGLMVKMLQSDASYYEPSRRSVNWLKLKKDYLAGVGDSLDLVVVGAYHGAGKRTGVYGAFLLACYDPETEEFQTICKIGTGFSEEALNTHHETLRALEVAVCRGDVRAGGAKPDVWLEPKIVWEVLAADLSLSPIYTAAQGKVDQRGISLRFPRFIRMRDDKNADDATGPDQISEMYERQALAQTKSSKKGGGGDDDFW